jgi:hypothetical protein
MTFNTYQEGLSRIICDDTMATMKQPKKRPRGQPKKANPASEYVHMRVTKDRKARWRAAAGEQGITAWLTKLADEAS